MSNLLGTDANVFSDLLILAEILISVLVLVGFVVIRRARRGQRHARVRAHRRVMLWTLGLNAFFLSGFLIQDAIRSQTVLSEERGLRAPLIVFVPLLVVHLAIAVTALGVAFIAWRIARKGIVTKEDGIDLDPEVRRRHTRVSRYYPYLWAATLATGLLLYYVVYVVY